MWKSHISSRDEKNSDYMGDKEVSPQGENFILPVGRRDEISFRVAGMKILPCNHKR